MGSLPIIYHALDEQKSSDHSLEDPIEKISESAAYDIACGLAFRGGADASLEWPDTAIEPK